MDQLTQILEKQNELSARVSLSFEQFQALPDCDKVAWVERYLKTISNESEELRSCLAWKWWKKQQSNDWAHAREEWIDLLHFVLNLGLVLGFAPDGKAIVEAYMDKNKVNQQRQDQGY